MECHGSGFKKIVSAYKSHDGYTDGMDPTFSTPWDSFVLTLPKFNVVGVEGVYISSDDVEDITEQGGQKGGQKSGQKEDEKTIDMMPATFAIFPGRNRYKFCCVTSKFIILPSSFR